MSGRSWLALDSALGVDALADERIVAQTVLGSVARGMLALRQRVAAPQ